MALYAPSPPLFFSRRPTYYIPRQTPPLTCDHPPSLPKTGDCKPRKPAPYLQVKKEGPNKGKYFYTCESRKCGFFLWEHDAQPRERDALLRHNCRSENGIVARVQAKGDPPADPVFAPRSVPPRLPPPPPTRQRIFRGLPQPDSLSMDSDEDDDSQDLSLFGGEGGRNQPNGTTRAGAAAVAAASSFTFQHQQPTTPSTKKPPNKRKRGGFLEDSDEEDLFGDSDLDDPDTERQLAALTAAATAAASGGPSVKRARFADDVPAVLDEDNDEDDEPTPRDPGRLLFPPKAQARGLGGGVGDVMGTTTTAATGTTTTPTTNRKTDAFRPITPSTTTTTTTTRSTSASTGTNIPTTTTMPTTPATTPASASAAIDHPLIADEVMALLARQPLSADARTGVRLALERHERQVRGLARGRAAARAALEGRERRVAELQARVVALENARRMDRARLREVSEGLVRMSQEDEEDEEEGLGLGLGMEGF